MNPDGTGHPIGSWFAVANSKNRGTKSEGQDWNRFAKNGEVSPHWRMEASKNDGGSWFNVAHNTTSGLGRNPVQRIEEEGVKQRTGGKHGWFGKYAPGQGTRNTSSNSEARKAASAQIAKIPFPLAQYVAKCFRQERGV